MRLIDYAKRVVILRDGAIGSVPVSAGTYYIRQVDLPHATWTWIEVNGRFIFVRELPGKVDFELEF